MSSSLFAPEMAEQLRLDSENPWPGLTAFTEGQQEFFYGRKEETGELFRCLKRERLTVLFGKSGLGKTSLLQAGLFPQLREAAFLPVYIRLSYADGSPTLDSQVQAALEAAVSVANMAEAATPQPGESIWEYLHRRAGNLINYEGSVVTPVLVFDQFEEWFTLGARRSFAPCLSEDFLPALTDLIENRTPRALTEKLTQDRDLARRYDLEAPACRILITLREDYLANLENLRDSMPSLVFVDNRMRLTEMNGRQAFSVVAEPNPDLVTSEIAEFIVRFVAGVHTDGFEGRARGRVPLEQLQIAPAILSLFCRQLNGERLKQALPRITQALVTSQGESIIDDFYQHCIAGMHPAVRRLIEDRLLTKSGYRDNIDLAQARTDLEQAGANSSCIDDLVRLRLLQVEEHRGVPRLELTHDVLADPVKRSRDKWDEQQAREKQHEQEQEALAQAKRAEQEALSRARFLQKVIAAVALVSLLLAALLFYALWERREAQANAVRAEASAQNEKQLKEQADASAQNEKQLKEQAEASAQNEKQLKEQADASASNERRMKEQAEEKQNKLTQVGRQFVDYCVNVSERFQKMSPIERVPSSSGGQDLFKERRKELSQASDDSSQASAYESLLMDRDACLTIAAKIHDTLPDDDQITAQFTLIPLLAADSARHRGDKRNVTEFSNSAVGVAEKLRHEKGRYGVTVLVARTYFVAAYELANVDDAAATADAERGMRIVADLRNHPIPKHSEDVDFYLGQVYLYNGYYLQALKKDTEAISAYEDSFNTVLAGGYRTEAVKRGIEIGAYERRLGNNDAALQWYQKSLTLALESGDRPGITSIYSGMRIALIAARKYDDAHTLLDQRIESLETHPRDIQGERDLATAYGDAAEVEEAKKQWQQAVYYRARAVKVLERLKADAYDGEQKDLAYAYSDLSWGEIFAGQAEQGFADAQTSIVGALKVNDLFALSDIYTNAIKALVANNKYDEARKLSDQHIQMLLNEPQDVEVERNLELAYHDSIRIDDETEDWARAVDDYKLRVVILTTLKEENAYDSVKEDLASAYGGLSWYEILSGRLPQGLEDANTGLSEDPRQTWIKVNQAHGLLLTGKGSEARDLYLKIKDSPRGNGTLLNDMTDDFKHLCRLGYAGQEMIGIAHDLGIRDPELSKCFAGAAGPK